MRVALWLALAVLFSQECGHSKGSKREKRSVLDLVLTLWCYRHRLQIPLLALNLYGCYCGTGGSGIPLDAVDQCCFLHDCCYCHARVSLKCHRRVKWQRYKLLCKTSETECQSTSVCGRIACECDKQLAECLMTAKPQRKHSFYNRGDLCKGPKDSCPVIHHNWTENLH
ncbi:phospholipase A2 crotoxin basic subunit CBd-like [Rhineura floridana]|uniref:phospholipase A2 crotoxin basic subunit CBd-like n=1 Tax=Rhineura floridana TaxID=261503 RepID=UPI002AC86A2E|nr:phospholipase A2 crotoxin basic subunit CBd-like [Rhineura floridana]XP_061465452.1 phospholipase A2 crotoxin basic subunit CBd-like [Rhineura floridana]XP_061465453.1 phospholipase A2 crotoxin basic subunit CBd-like [Rhineura floridana]XP_061465454.1 phospholipase A2 crotoxin basic subunit CBd-like [Rhineura floridana]